MEIRIFDVSHGFCAYIIADNGNVMLIDCGHNHETGFRPSSYLKHNGCSAIQRFIISNYDEDHLSDLPDLRKNFNIDILHRNPTINVEELQRLKLEGGPIQPGAESLLDMVRDYTSEVTNPPEFPGVELTHFRNNFPTFEDTNNLSLVTFIHYRDIHIIFPGDLEKAGWEALLEQQAFKEQLKRVNIFVASHHGRESGYCKEVFDYCNPQVIIISDESIKYDTQDVPYDQHAEGVKFGDETRYVLTTRNDGLITVSQVEGSNPNINISNN